MQFPAPSETFACSDIRQLIKQNNRVSVHCLRPAHKLRQKLIDEQGLQNIKITQLTLVSLVRGLIFGIRHILTTSNLIFRILASNFSSPKQVIKGLLLLPQGLAILREIEKIKPDIVHLFWGSYPAIVGKLVKKLLPNIHLTTFLGAYDLHQGFGLSKEVANLSNLVFTHAFCNIKLLRRRGIPESNVCVIHRGIDIDFLAGKSIQPDIKKDRNVILTAGRLITTKNFSFALDAFSQMACSNPHQQLIIVGDGPEREHLHHQCARLSLTERVSFTGHLSQNELFGLMQAAQYFFFFSTKTSERLPNVVKEAMYARCVVISSKTPGIEELIINNENGIVLNDLNVEAIQKAVELTQENASEIGDKARQTVVEGFNAATQMQKYTSKWLAILDA